MITNETRAKLIGNTAKVYADDALSFWCVDATGARGGYWCGKPPSYDTDANATRELINYLWHHQGHNAVGRFFHEITKIVGCTRDDAFSILRATPAQQCAAFDVVFKDELERTQ